MHIKEIHLKKIDSTNTYAKKHAAEFEEGCMTCITAEEQTAGRGRYQRTWISPPKLNLYVTFFFRLPPNTLHLSCLSHILAYSLLQILEQKKLSPAIKWPNDILLNGKKLSGVLCETLVSTKEIEVILGIGVNVNMPQKLLSQIDQPATSLLQETGHKWKKKILLKKLQKQFVENLQLFLVSGFSAFHDAFEQLLAYKGQIIRLFDGEKQWEGICHSLTADGRLNLLLPGKTIQTFSTGDLL